MRLGSKIFLTSALVIVVLAGVGVLSLRAVGRLVSVNREITTQTVPALRLPPPPPPAPPPPPPAGGPHRPPPRPGGGGGWRAGRAAPGPLRPHHRRVP